MTDATSGDPTEVLSDATKVLSDPAGCYSVWRARFASCLCSGSVRQQPR
jgi:hypothetical protein